MDRRAVLVLCGTTATAIAGCGGARNPTTPTADPETGTATAGTPSTRSLTVQSVAAPETVELGQRYGLALTVNNPTEQSRSFETGVSVRVDDEWTQYRTLTGTVPPGTTIIERELRAPRLLGPYRFRLDTLDAEWQLKAVARRLQYGASFRTPRDLTLTVLGGDMTDTYATGTNRTVTPADGQQFVVVTVQIGNPTAEPIDAPPFNTFTVRSGGDRYPVSLANPDQRLTVEPNETTRIALPFAVPRSVTPAELTVRWTAVYQRGRAVAIWHQ